MTIFIFFNTHISYFFLPRQLGGCFKLFRSMTLINPYPTILFNTYSYIYTHNYHCHH